MAHTFVLRIEDDDAGERLLTALTAEDGLVRFLVHDQPRPDADPDEEPTRTELQGQLVDHDTGEVDVLLTPKFPAPPAPAPAEEDFPVLVPLTLQEAAQLVAETTGEPVEQAPEPESADDDTPVDAP